MDDARLQQLVTPYYLHLMRLNALRAADDLIPQVVEVSRSTDVEEIVELLGQPWRQKVMGAWLSLAHPQQDMEDAVLGALRTSFGSLDSPPLAVASVVVAGDRALAAMHDYVERDVENSWGACGFVAAAIEYLGDTCAACTPSPQDVRDFAEMLDLAERLQRGA